jgi:hypothetical protein
MSSCSLNNLSDVTLRVKAVSQCCTKLSVARTKTPEAMFRKDARALEETKINPISYLPAYSWDTKMMFW